MHIDSITNGFVIDHITPGRSMRIYDLLGLDNLDCSVAIIKNVASKKLGKKDIIKIDADMVVLAAAIEPDKTARPLATMLTASMDTNDFFTEAHPKLRPVESPTAGVFLSGACQGPKDIPETSDASVAAIAAVALISVAAAVVVLRKRVNG